MLDGRRCTASVSWPPCRSRYTPAARRSGGPAAPVFAHVDADNIALTVRAPPLGLRQLRLARPSDPEQEQPWPVGIGKPDRERSMASATASTACPRRRRAAGFTLVQDFLRSFHQLRHGIPVHLATISAISVSVTSSRKGRRLRRCCSLQAPVGAQLRQLPYLSSDSVLRS